jgi:plastocyanin
MRRTMRAEKMVLAAAIFALLTATARAETVKVAMSNVAYAPATISARVGDTIVWENNDIVAHTATARDKSWDLMVLPKKTGTVTLKAAGAIAYYCKFHPNMVGHIEVKE